MNAAVTLTQRQLSEFLLHAAPVRPVFIWGPPGIGKSSLVEVFAESVGLPCVSLLGSQLAPEDIIGVPHIQNGKSVFCPPEIIAREEPYALFLDELNACSHEVMKAFYSLILNGRIGNFSLPKGSIVIGAGNRTQDSAIVKQMSSALINRMVHVHLSVSSSDWLTWAREAEIHDFVYRYVAQNPRHLWTEPPKHEEPFSTPRSWHIFSDLLKSYKNIADLPSEALRRLAYGCLTPFHASNFVAFIKQLGSEYQLDHLLKGDVRWPSKPEDRDLLYYLAIALRERLLKELPDQKSDLAGDAQKLAHKSKALMRDLAALSHEMAQMVVADEADAKLPTWFLIDVGKDLPRLAIKNK